MISPNIPSNIANVIAPTNPVGQKPIGEELSSNRITTTKPVEQLAASGKTQIRSRERSLENADIDAISGAGFNTVDQTESPNSGEADEQLLERRAQEQAREEARQQRQLEIDQQKIRELASRDKEVRAHEQAHANVGGQYASAPTYEFERGPNGVRYAVGGEVSIDTSKEATPQETIRKAQIIRRAALAPAEPSPQDRRVAAEGSRLEAEARRELRVEQREEAQESSESDESGSNSSTVSSDSATAASPVSAPGSSTVPAASTSTGTSPNTLSSLNAPVSPLSYPGSITSRLNETVLTASLANTSPGILLDQLA